VRKKRKKKKERRLKSQGKNIMVYRATIKRIIGVRLNEQLFVMTASKQDHQYYRQPPQQ